MAGKIAPILDREQFSNKKYTFFGQNPNHQI
jgi:hypothetical protein